jgi:hypothetical protein
MAVREKKIVLDDVMDVQSRQQKRPAYSQFLLQVDRQTKSSYDTFEAAETAGHVIKKNHPIVQVAVYDSVTNTNTVLEA